MAESKDKAEKKQAVRLNGLFALKVGMSSFWDENGEVNPVTVLKCPPTFISQVKTKEKDGYEAVQLALVSRKKSRSSKADLGQLKGTPFETGARYRREIRQSLPEGIEVGQSVAVTSLQKGDVVKVTGKSKGRGFSGVVRRWSFAGGRASHGGGWERKPGSVGQRNRPGRLMPNKKLPGHYGDERTTTRNLVVMDVLEDEGVILVRGAVPGAPNSLIRVMKVD